MTLGVGWAVQGHGEPYALCGVLGPAALALVVLLTGRARTSRSCPESWLDHGPGPARHGAARKRLASLGCHRRLFLAPLSGVGRCSRRCP